MNLTSVRSDRNLPNKDICSGVLFQIAALPTEPDDGLATSVGIRTGIRAPHSIPRGGSSDSGSGGNRCRFILAGIGLKTCDLSIIMVSELIQALLEAVNASELGLCLLVELPTNERDLFNLVIAQGALAAPIELVAVRPIDLLSGAIMLVAVEPVGSVVVDVRIAELGDSPGRRILGPVSEVLVVRYG